MDDIILERFVSRIEDLGLSIDHIDDDIFESMVFNILPEGNTIMHKLCEKQNDE